MISTPFHTPQMEVLDWLSTRQFVRPHESLASVLSLFEREASTNVPCETIDGISPSTKIGLLSRAQLETIAVRLVNNSRDSH